MAAAPPSASPGAAPPSASPGADDRESAPGGGAPGPEVSEFTQRYALGLAPGGAASAPEGRPPSGPPVSALRRRKALLARLRRIGVRGWPGRMTLFTRKLPAGCRECLQGCGSNLVLTGLCTRECFFCFNPKPRLDETSVHGLKAETPAEAAALLRRFGVRSVGLSGGEPLLVPDRTLAFVAGLRAELGPDVRIDLYTNGDLLTPDLAARLKAAGLSALRLNLAARGYDLAPAAVARAEFADVEVEIPAIPAHLERLKRLVGELEEARVPQLILHELFLSAENREGMAKAGYAEKVRAGPANLLWSPVEGSLETALEVLLHARRSARRLSVYFCSCGTQEWIATNGLARRRPGEASPLAPDP